LTVISVDDVETGTPDDLSTQITKVGRLNGRQKHSRILAYGHGPIGFKKALKTVARDNLHGVQKDSSESVIEPGNKRESWNPKTILALIFCAAFLAIQIAVPIAKLASQRPARFGWHMWSARKKFPQFFLVKGETKRPADLSRYIAWSRGEMDFTDALPAHLCREIPDIDGVEIRMPDNQPPKTHACR
jgi:hypothetical protein